MKRFIEPAELARDRRFLRQSNVAANILSNLPDDVDKVVEVFEQLAPVIERGVIGTAAEPLYEEYGPAFTLVTLQEPLRKDSPALESRLQQRIHGIFVGELQALEGAARSIWDFPEAPWEFKMNMARQCWDEARHVQIFEKLLEHSGGEIGMYPESTFLFEACCSDDPALRVAGVNRGLEGTDDSLMEQAVDFVLADELTHVRFGSEWVREFTKNDPERLERAQAFRREVDKQFSFGGSRSDREDAAIPIARQDRLDAGFTEEELNELAELSSGGPSQKTMREVVRILIERHQASRSKGGASKAPRAEEASA
jgi:uncharacterized ferritin-like protein (DUF455 family)